MYITDDRRGAAAVVPREATRISLYEDTGSIDENDVDEETISGENDVEYAEFSMSLRISPKEGSKATKSDGSPLTSVTPRSTDGEVLENVRNFNRLDEDFMLSLAGIRDSGTVSSASAG